MARPKLKNVTRITVNVPTPLLNRIDSYCDSLSISRTTGIMLLCSDALAQLQADKDSGTSPNWDEENQRYF